VKEVVDDDGADEGLEAGSEERLFGDGGNAEVVGIDERRTGGIEGGVPALHQDGAAVAVVFAGVVQQHGRREADGVGAGFETAPEERLLRPGDGGEEQQQVEASHSH
jgi:hypothetical protein